MAKRKKSQSADVTSLSQLSKKKLAILSACDMGRGEITGNGVTGMR